MIVKSQQGKRQILRIYSCIMITRNPIGYLCDIMVSNPTIPHMYLPKYIEIYIYICTVCTCAVHTLFYCSFYVLLLHSHSLIIESPRRHRWRVSPAPCWIRSKVNGGRGGFFVETEVISRFLVLTSCCNMIIYHIMTVKKYMDVNWCINDVIICYHHVALCLYLTLR